MKKEIKSLSHVDYIQRNKKIYILNHHEISFILKGEDKEEKERSEKKTERKRGKSNGKFSMTEIMMMVMNFFLL